LPGRELDDVVNAVAGAYDATYSEMAGGAEVRASYESLAERNAGAFAAAHPDDPQVFYQSWAGVSNVLGIANPKDAVACEGLFVGVSRWRRDVMDPRLVATAAIVAHGREMRPNDGLVTVESAKHGLFRGCLPADHIDEIGGTVGGTTFVSRFDHVRFYRELAFDLTARGF
jgi:triacylglycerol lipase